MKRLLFLLPFFALLYACAGDASIETQIRQKASDGEITAAELAELKTASKLDCAALLAKITEATANSRRGAPKVADCAADPNNGGNGGNTNVSKSANIYVENSASMFGYMEGNTQFREALMSLSSTLEDKGMKNTYFFINDKPYSLGNSFRQFIDAFNPATARKHGKTDASVLDAMLETIVQDVIKTGNTAVFASDFIFAIPAGKKLDAELLNAKFRIKSIFDKLQKAGDYGVLVLRLQSSFNGTYFDYQNKRTVLNDERRPFYIWIIGKNALLQTFESQFQTATLAGYENSVLFYLPSNQEKRYLSLLPQTETLGNFTRSRDAQGAAVGELTGVTGDERKDGMIQFAAIADLSRLPINEKDLLATDNYQVESNLDLSIVKILPISQLSFHKNDERYKGTATHAFIFTTRSKVKDRHEIKLRLLQKMPAWIELQHSSDDSQIKQQLPRTFGLKFLLSGLAEAYIPAGSSPKHAEFSFTLSK